MGKSTNLKMAVLGLRLPVLRHSLKNQQNKLENTPPKQAKSEDRCGGQIVGLSPEQKHRMEENREKALARLHTKQTGCPHIDVGESWKPALEPEFSKPYFQQLTKFVDEARKKQTIYPTPENVFSWTRACSLTEVKVVVLGQDPYHGPHQAHGLCFSVLPGVKPPPSLLNMYKELADDIPEFRRPSHGYLEGWARQGVLLLNAVLTVQAHQANSHRDKGWEKFTDAVISYLNTNLDGLVFMLWGAYAQKKGAHIDKTKHHVLCAVHPSPLSAHRGFMGCRHFSKCNELLLKNGKTPINWSDLPAN